VADGRTEEQRKADEALSAAIERCIAAYEYSQPGAITTGYMVLVNQRIYQEDGRVDTGVVRMYQDGTMPWVEILGLLRASTLSVESEYLREGLDG